jgi:hypothetical protein
MLGRSAVSSQAKRVSMATIRETVGGLSPTRRRVLVGSVWVAGAAVLLVLFELASLHTVTISPDGSTVLLEGQSLNAGNLTLHGWWLSLDSFWTVDAPFYAVAVRIFGVTPLLLNLVPAAIAVLVVIAAMRLAAAGSRGAARAAAMAAVVALVALPSPDLIDYLLQGPWHVGSTLCCLLAFAGASRHRFGWSWVLTVAALTAGLLGDLMALAVGVVPVLGAGLAAMARERRWRTGLPALSAGLVAVAISVAIRQLADLVGTFTLVSRNLSLEGAHLERNVRYVWRSFAGLLGVGNLKVKGITNGAPVFRVLHLVAVLVIVAAVLGTCYGLIRGVIRSSNQSDSRESWCLDDLILFAILADVIFFVGGSQSGNLEFVKYLTPGVVFAAILVGRMGARVTPWLRARGVARAGVVAGLLLSAAFAIEFGIQISRPVPSRPAYVLAQFLSANHLRDGVGDYWSSSLVTVEADDAVTVRPVSTVGDKIVQFQRQSSADWYRAQRFNFLVYDTARPWHGVDKASAIATFGKPSRSYAVGTYRVLEWASGIEVAPPPATSIAPIRIG